MTYSPAPVDVLSIELVPGVVRAESREIAPQVVAGFDPQGRMIALEVRLASRIYNRRDLQRIVAQEPEYLTPEAAVAECHLSVRTLREEIAKGRIPAKKEGLDLLVDRHEFWNYLMNRTPRGRRGRVRKALEGIEERVDVPKGVAEPIDS